MHTSKHKEVVQHSALEKNFKKIKTSSLLIVDKGIKYCILEAKYYGKLIFMKYCSQNT